MHRLVLCLLLQLGLSFLARAQDSFRCTPCGRDCDAMVYTQGRKCPYCAMALVPVRGEDAKDIRIAAGSGVFTWAPSDGQREEQVYVFYHRPRNFNKSSGILIVIPGAGRNGDDYRDAWVEASERYGVLVLSPSYPEAAFDFSRYHMGGMVSHLDITGHATRIGNTNKVVLDEAGLQFQIVDQAGGWLFEEFDQLFDIAVNATGSERTGYDLFGHSAGGQILHRLAVFYPDSGANRIIAANSGFYTLPDMRQPLLFGIKGSPVTVEGLAKSFRKNLVLFLGERDDAREAGGTLLLSPSANRQGGHRLERGYYFYHYSRKLADSLGLEFNWNLRVVPNVGHEYKKMSAAAGRYLYEQ